MGQQLSQRIGLGKSLQMEIEIRAGEYLLDFNGCGAIFLRHCAELREKNGG